MGLRNYWTDAVSERFSAEPAIRVSNLLLLEQPAFCMSS
jgi:hypothetical protein